MESNKADEEKLTALHDLRAQLQMQGVHPDMSAAQMQLLTAKMAPKDISALKKSLLRQGFVEEWNSLDSLAAGFAKVLVNKANSTPSASYKLFTTHDPEAVLWLGFTSKDNAVKAKYDLFLKTWPEARQRIPYLQMQEMRITPELPAYKDIIHQVFLQLIDGNLNTPEEIRAFLEPHSPPAPPPQVTIKRTRAKRGVEKIKEKSFDEEDESEEGAEEDLDDIGGEDEEIDLGLNLPKGDELEDLGDEEDGEAEDEDEGEEEAPVRKGHGKPEPAPKGAKGSEKKAEQPAAKAAPKPVAAAKPAPAGKATPAAKVVAKEKPEAEKPEKAKAAPAKKPMPPPAKHPHPAKPVAAKAPAKPAAKPHKAEVKAHAKPAHKSVPAKKAAPPAKAHSSAKAAKKPAAKTAKKR